MQTKPVAEGLRQLRIDARMSQQDLAERLMVDKAYISRVENGHRIPDAETYNNWIAATNGPIFMFTYVFGSDTGGFKTLLKV